MGFGDELIGVKTCNYNFSGKIISQNWRPNLNYFSKTQPQQMVIRFENIGTWCVFPSGSCRLTGCKTSESSATAKYRLEQMLEVKISDMRLTNFTAILLMNDLCDFQKICRLATSNINVVYEPELFNACVVAFGSIRACIFHTGKIVIMGLKSSADLECIKDDIKDIINITF